MAETPFDDWLLRENEQTCRNLGRTRRPIGPARPGANQQSYQNCGLECCRQIINRVRQREGKEPVSEQLLLIYALRQGLAQGPLLSSQVPVANWRQFGGTSAGDRRDLLADFGIVAELRGRPFESEEAARNQRFQMCILPALAERKGVVAAVWGARLWPPSLFKGTGISPGAPEVSHAVVPIACNGGSVFLNDSGVLAHCGRTVPVALFVESLIATDSVLITRDPVWI